MTLTNDPHHYVVVDLGFGDAGKGATVDWLCAERDIDTVIRFSGGCQAAHNVITEDGKHHTFAMFGSGTFRGAKTILAAPTMVEPFAIGAEADALQMLGETDILDRLTIDGRCKVTTPYHWIANRIMEDMRAGAGVQHGSCGRGIGETAALNGSSVHALTGERFEHSPLTAAHLLDHEETWVRLMELWRHMRARFGEAHLDKWPHPQELREAYKIFGEKIRIERVGFHDMLHEKPVVFEGSQGVLLDENYGFNPHTTWSTVTAELPVLWCDMTGAENYTVLGVARTYTTRHGAGPMPTEDAELPLPEAHNGTGQYQGGWRVGHFDAPLHRYAARAMAGRRTKTLSADKMKLVLTHVDREGDAQFCSTYIGAVNRAVAAWGLDSYQQPILTESERRNQRLKRARPYLDGPVTVGRVVDALGLELFGVADGPSSADREFVAPAVPA